MGKQQRKGDRDDNKKQGAISKRKEERRRRKGKEETAKSKRPQGSQKPKRGPEKIINEGSN